jgi:hypothetical protein
MIKTPNYAEGGSVFSRPATGSSYVETIVANIATIAAAANGTTIYEVDSAFNFSPNATVVSAGNNDAENDGTFVVTGVTAPASGTHYITLRNPAGVVDAAAIGTITWIKENRALHVDILGGSAIEDVSILDTTNLAAATHYYPSATGTTMDGFSDCSFSGKLVDADGTITMTFEAMNDDDATGDWIQVYGYDDKNNVTTNSWSITNGALTFAISFNNCNYKRVRVKVVNDGATNTIIIKARKKGL